MRQTGNALFEQFAASLNDELICLGCAARISEIPPPLRGWMSIVNLFGDPIGNIPDTVDAAAIAAFVQILSTAVGHPLRFCGHADL